jgi:hypothetical protein
MPLTNGTLAGADVACVGEEDLGAGEIDALGHAAKAWLAEQQRRQGKSQAWAASAPIKAMPFRTAAAR